MSVSLPKIKNNPLTLTAFGAAQDVGKSCFLLSNDGRKVLIDCGITINPRRSGRKSEGPKGILPLASELSAVIISHAHLDHSGYVPALIREGFDGPIFTTKPSVDIMDLLWNDHLKIEGDIHFRQEHVHTALDNIRAFDYNTKIKVCEGVYAKFVNAGHILGAAQIILDFDGMLFHYTGDINDQETPFHDRFVIPEEPADVLLTETTNAGRPLPPRNKVTKSLIDTIKSTYKRGGKVLIPAFALGRSQEIQKYLIQELDSSLASIPVYIDGMILKMNTIYEKYFSKEWVSQRAIDDTYDRNTLSPFEHENFHHVSKDTIGGNMDKYRKHLIESKKRMIIITTSGMLEGGPIHSYLKWQKSREDMLAICGYQAEGTIGREILMNGIRKFDFITPWKEKVSFNLQLQVENFPFSGHARREGLVDLIEETKPTFVYGIHGSLESQETFRSYLQKNTTFDLKQMTIKEPLILAQ